MMNISKEESLDEKIARIRKKNEEILKRKQIIDEDIEIARKNNAIVNLKTFENCHLKSSLYSDKLDGRNYKNEQFRLDKNEEDAAWREERKKIDSERIRRQKADSGNWKREWDVDKIDISVDYEDTAMTKKSTINRDNKRYGSEKYENGSYLRNKDNVITSNGYNFNEKKIKTNLKDRLHIWRFNSRKEEMFDDYENPHHNKMVDNENNNLWNSDNPSKENISSTNDIVKDAEEINSTVTNTKPTKRVSWKNDVYNDKVDENEICPNNEIENIVIHVKNIGLKNERQVQVVNLSQPSINSESDDTCYSNDKLDFNRIAGRTLLAVNRSPAVKDPVYAFFCSKTDNTEKFEVPINVHNSYGEKIVDGSDSVILGSNITNSSAISVYNNLNHKKINGIEEKNNIHKGVIKKADTIDRSNTENCVKKQLNKNMESDDEWEDLSNSEDEWEDVPDNEFLNSTS